VALIVVFIGAAAGVGQPLTAVQMLWVNLIMDTLGALALGTEKPIPELLQRKPYKRESPLISWPMWRNIAVQGTYQLVLLFVLMFAGASMFGVRDMSSDPCFVYETTDDTGTYTANGNSISCSDWDTYCKGEGDDCYEESKTVSGTTFAYSDWDSTDFKENCLSCTTTDYTHGTIIFNAFIWCQIFNEYTARNLFDDWNALRGITTNPMFLFVSVFSILLQALIVEFGKDFTSTSPLTAGQWGWTILLGWFSMIFGVIQRFIPVEEDPNTFFTSEEPTGGGVAAEKKKGDYNQVAVAEVEMSENKA
jgi:magnesium-transporting ATPase (P-type)